MAVTLGSNISALRNMRQLALASDRLERAFAQLASGSRVTRGSDDAAGLSISMGLIVSSRVFTQGIRNLNDGISALSIANGALDQLSSIVIRQQELAEQAANGF